MISVGIVGATGYAGIELMRLLSRHPHVGLRVVTSRGHEGVRVDEMFPHLRGHLDLRFESPDTETLAACDAVLFATPTGTAMTAAPALLESGVRVIDLAADFRVGDLEQWQRWYGATHRAPALAHEAIYGLPELNRDEIRSARLVANPGCYATAVILALLPALEQRLIEPAAIYADGKSGVSGAGRKAQLTTSMGEAGESLKAYAASGHRHLAEIQQTLAHAAGGAVGIVFVPHLIPMIRGIHATVYARLRDPSSDMQSSYEARYEPEPFVDVMGVGSHPETRGVRGINVCRLALHRPGDGDSLVVLSVIDNLVKGAAGQAVQNLNLMFDLAETDGLEGVALAP